MVRHARESLLGRLAQVARALPLQGRGRGFESLSAHERNPLGHKGFLLFAQFGGLGAKRRESARSPPLAESRLY